MCVLPIAEAKFIKRMTLLTPRSDSFQRLKIKSEQIFHNLLLNVESHEKALTIMKMSKMFQINDDVSSAQF